MSFTKETGDLFANPAQALAHGVNCQGVTGGLASVMFDRYYDAMLQYRVLASQGYITPGSAVLTHDSIKDRAIIHCASQNVPGADATEEWLCSSLTQGLDLAHKQGIESVALPLIGGGIGGLHLAAAEKIIREVAEKSPVTVTLVQLG